MKTQKNDISNKRYLSFCVRKYSARDRFHSLHDTRRETGLLLFAVWMENETFHYIAVGLRTWEGQERKYPVKEEEKEEEEGVKMSIFLL